MQAPNRNSLNTCLRKIHFFAQIYHETKLFGSTYENTNAVYQGGNFYQGRGFIQVTGKENYQNFYKSIKNTQEVDDNELMSFVPTIATSMELAMKSTIWYWKKENINKYADLDDVERVSAAINYPARLKQDKFSSAGIRGLDARMRYSNILKNVFDYENCK